MNLEYVEQKIKDINYFQQKWSQLEEVRTKKNVLEKIVELCKYYQTIKSRQSENEIDKIKIYATSQHFSDSVGVSALPYNDYYYYIKVDLKNGEKINLSSLIDYKIDKIITENFKTIGIIEQPSTFVMLLTK